MKTLPAKSARCAIYTRKSTEHGLELEFNSLDAQREACAAYIKSQASLGWKAVPARYDDPAFSGGSLERPALQNLMSDIQAGRVDVVVVYKIDRLTRSLADFAKLVELFDKKSVSFVAVTQQFNTTTSMGRLTLNILLSFAQFERELSSERVRDKFAASRKKGKWMGGNSPFGYRSKEKKLVIDNAEAKTVRHIFAQYLELKSIEKLVVHLSNRNISTRVRALSSRRTTGGVSFGFGALCYLLKNQIYIGKVSHKGIWFTGEHEAIVDRKIFDQVQELLKSQSVVRRRKRSKSYALLTGKIFDDRGNRMSPTYTTKKGARYRFYVSSALLTGNKDRVGSVRRVPALSVEQSILKTLRANFIKEEARSITDNELVSEYIDRVVIRLGTIEIFLHSSGSNTFPQQKIDIPSTFPSKANCRIEQNNRALNEKLRNAVISSHMMLKLLLEGNSINAIARVVKSHPRSVSFGLRFAFLAPDITERALRANDVSIGNFIAFQKRLPLSWKEQRLLIE